MHYKIYATKIPVLEKIFDRVYSKKATVGTQCNTGIYNEENDASANLPKNKWVTAADGKP